MNRYVSRWHQCSIAMFWLMLIMIQPWLWAAECPLPPSPPSPEAIQQLKAHARDHGFLWKISKNGHDSWLYGTIHIGKPDWIVLGPKVQAALEASQVVALEFDPLDVSLQQQVAMLMAKGAGGQIPDTLKPRLKALMDSVCIPSEMMDKLHPALLFSMLEVEILRKAGLEPEYGVDMVVSGYAHVLGKEVKSLETPESQMHALVGDDVTVKPAEVRSALDDFDSGKVVQVDRKLMEAWERSDVHVMEHYDQLCDCLNTDYERIQMKRLLDDRNAALADEVDVLHNKGKRVFVAVGSLHMMGKIGLPELLRQRGYVVTPVLFER